jgi:C-terminal processing protease CtpA/Prc
MLHDPHASYTPGVKIRDHTAAASGEEQQPSDAGTDARPSPEIPRIPTGRILSDGVAYVVVPGCSASGIDELRDYARAAAAELSRLDSHSPKGWLIELRLNGGGNLWPMLLGLRPLLADGALMTTVRDGRVESRFGLSERSSWVDWGAGPEAQLEWGEAGAPQAMRPYAGRIAVLIGPWTMSSGEGLAMCLASRGNMQTFGEATAGLTTVTNQYVLFDGSMLTLPVSRMGDRNGHAVVGAIVPMKAMPFEDWPNAEDGPAQAARSWLLEKP